MSTGRSALASGRCRSLALCAGFAVVAGLAAPASTAATDLPGSIELVVREPSSPRLVPRASPALPSTDDFPVQLVLDDDSPEGTVGVADAGGAREFLWFNRFSVAGPIELEEVWVLFPSSSSGVAIGDAIQLAVYEDDDSDPTNGADLLATFSETVQAADGNTFSVYSLAPPVAIDGPGDVLIGVVPRFISPGDPVASPASIDNTATQTRSWIAIWSGDPPDPPELPPNVLVDLIDNVAPAAAGNWMIRGFGREAAVVPAIPTLSAVGLLAVAALLGAGGAVLSRRRRRSGA